MHVFFNLHAMPALLNVYMFDIIHKWFLIIISIYLTQSSEDLS